MLLTNVAGLFTANPAQDASARRLGEIALVDDAIMVVEAVEHHIEEGMNPHDATVRAMEQVSGPVST